MKITASINNQVIHEIEFNGELLDGLLQIQKEINDKIEIKVSKHENQSES